MEIRRINDCVRRMMFKREEKSRVDCRLSRRWSHAIEGCARVKTIMKSSRKDNLLVDEYRMNESSKIIEVSS